MNRKQRRQNLKPRPQLSSIQFQIFLKYKEERNEEQLRKYLLEEFNQTLEEYEIKNHIKYEKSCNKFIKVLPP